MNQAIKKSFSFLIFFIFWIAIALIPTTVSSNDDDGAKIATTVLSLCVLPIALWNYIFELVIPATNKRKDDDVKAHPGAFILYYLGVILGWTMVWMAIFTWSPSSYENIESIDNPYQALLYVLPAATFVSCGTASSWAIPSKALSNVIQMPQLLIGWLTIGILINFIFKATDTVVDVEQKDVGAKKMGLKFRS